MTEITRLFDFAYYQLEKNNLPNCLVTKYDGQWIATSTKEYIDKANAISRALLRLNLQQNAKVALISSSNRTEWNVMDVGVLQIGAQTVPIYPTISSEDYAYILNHSESKYCFVSDEVVYQKLQMPGVTAHAWLVLGMTQTSNGYRLLVLDSNTYSPDTYYYEKGMTSFGYHGFTNFVPYTGKTKEENKLKSIVAKDCSFEEPEVDGADDSDEESENN